MIVDHSAHLLQRIPGALCFITNDESDMYDVELIDELIGGTGPNPLCPTKKGKKNQAS